MTRREALARHPLAILGALITTASAVAFVALAIAVLAGLFENPYAGLVVFIALPTLFVIGLLLIPAGMWLQSRKLERDPGAATDWPVLDFRQASIRRTALAITALTAVNMQTSYLSPPVAMSAYYLRNVVPQWRLSTIYKGMADYMVIQVIVLGLLLLYPQIALWLPHATR